MTDFDAMHRLASSRRAAAYDDGYLAAINRVSVNRNPHPADTEEGERQAWFDGHRDGEAESEA
jgi:hypothetical protein